MLLSQRRTAAIEGIKVPCCHSVALGGGLAKPRDRLALVLLNATAVLAHRAEIVLRGGKALLGRNVVAERDTARAGQDMAAASEFAELVHGVRIERHFSLCQFTFQEAKSGSVRGIRSRCVIERSE